MATLQKQLYECAALDKPRYAKIKETIGSVEVLLVMKGSADEKAIQAHTAKLLAAGLIEAPDAPDKVEAPKEDAAPDAQRKIRILRVDAIRPHPQNALIYGDEADDDLVASVREHGVMVPVCVAKDESGDYTLISGHRRVDAAKKNGLPLVPAEIVGYRTADEMLALLIHMNFHREKTPEMRAREFQMLRQIRGAKDGLRSDTVAAREVGWSHVTARKAQEVVEEIDKAEKAGDKERAKEIRETLNTGKISRAHEKAGLARSRRPQAPVIVEDPGEEENDADHARCGECAQLRSELAGLRRKCERLQAEVGALEQRLQSAEDETERLRDLLAEAGVDDEVGTGEDL